MLFGSRLNRLATSIRRGISKYSVGSDNPGLVFDFIDNFYQKDKNQTVNFDGAITHARSGNAVMTDGYGPELVVNGGFDSDSDWSKGTGWSIADGVATHTGSAGYLQQTGIVETGKVYELSFRITAIGSGEVFAYGINSFGVGGTTTGTYTGLVTATNANIRFRATGEASIDSVSVREMPVLKWAPHNELTYSAFDSATPTNWSVGFGTGTYNHTLGSEISNLPTITQEQTASGRSYLTQNVTLKANTTYTLKMLVDENLSSITDGNNKILSANISGASGTLSASIDDVSDGKVEITFTTGSTTSGTVRAGIGVLNDAVGTVVFAAPHLYRSDLGGMVDNPDRGDSYVPTTSSAKYLPRIGHHVYNGSAWVNEGLLAESEQRVNLTPYSDFASDILANNLTVSTNQAVSPDGAESATELTETGANNYHRVYQGTNITGTANSDHTFSAYVKRGSGARDIQLRAFYLGTGAPYVNFDLGDGTVGASSGASGTSASSHTWTLANTNIQEVGNGWYRISATIDASSDFTVGFVLVDDAATATEQEAYQGDSTSSILIYGAQFEEGSTPSSLIPTSGQQGTRASESFTIPSANLPWPEPNYIGSELQGSAQGSNSELSGVYSGAATSYLSVTSGNVYRISVTISNYTAGLFDIGDNADRNTIVNNLAANGTYVYYFVPDDGTIYFTADANSDFTLDISVREINPLSVSIAMDGRVTYADDNAAVTVRPWRWRVSGGNEMQAIIRGSTNKFLIEQAESGTFDKTQTDMKTPDVLVPHNFASRHGSTFTNSAYDGVALTENTTPTALVDLSATDLELAEDYMGTVGTFRVWDKDIGDTGLVEATNPSLEPSLSLTFEGTGTNSFVVNNWSE